MSNIIERVIAFINESDPFGDRFSAHDLQQLETAMTDNTPRPSTPAKEREQNSKFGSPAGAKIRSGQDDPREPEATIGNPPGVSGSHPFASTPAPSEGDAELADRLSKWVEALSTPTIREFSINDIALINGECITDDIEKAAAAIRALPTPPAPKETGR